ncbi:MarR family winged helix-turn-helix transcriptional regulator [Marinicrinis sediminis]|uniref:MarR family winged helix-turn-helix transcriptional regulator n=1 Tax=Marinicrinis sediminis TaxID=1652465 RepID=A0ABW5RFZ2_9BACL
MEPTMEHRPERIEETIAYRMYRTSRLIRHLHYMTLQQNGFDLSPEQWFILNKLHVKSPQTQIELGESLIDDRPNMTRLLNAMEKKGWVKRQPDTRDRRKMQVHVTEEGLALIEACLPPVKKAREAMRHELDAADLAAFWRTLDQLDANLGKRIKQK